MTTEETKKEPILVHPERLTRALISIMNAIDSIDQIEKSVVFCEKVLADRKDIPPSDTLDLIKQQLRSTLADLARSSSIIFYAACDSDLSRLP